MLFAFGCKEKTEQAGGPEPTREVASEKPQKNIGDETFTIQVRYDTQELYGKVTGMRQIVISRN
jgi:hypothetical protein